LPSKSVCASPRVGPLIEKLEVGVTAQFPNGMKPQLHYTSDPFVLTVEAIGDDVANSGGEEGQAVGQMPQVEVNSVAFRAIRLG
jgi:hypothetical protein